MTNKSESSATGAGPGLTRRRLLAAGAVVPIASVAAAGVIRREMPWQAGEAAAPRAATAPHSGRSTASSTPPKAPSSKPRWRG